ncbi:MAG TPA: hydroxymethylbilane synthase [Gaiellales bacterium]|nr:hydroxymethylbilane synthase [Gaiellales bacterium]
MIRLGSRASALALAQARLVADLLGGAEVVAISTAGDRDRRSRFDAIGDGRGVFTRDIERALLDGDVDAAVHSAKDLTGEMSDGLEIGAVPQRGDARDACCGPFTGLDEIPAGARVGTSSARRAALLESFRPDLVVVPLRGNVETRLEKLDRGDADVIVLAACGLHRLGLADRIAFTLDPAQFVPEAGQGFLAVQVRRGESAMVAAADHAPSRALLDAERTRAAELGGGCSVPVAAHAWYEHGQLRLRSWAAA